MLRVRIAVVALVAVVLGTAGIVLALDCEGRLVIEGVPIAKEPKTSIRASAGNAVEKNEGYFPCVLWKKSLILSSFSVEFCL
jgi:hypothetical protein